MQDAAKPVSELPFPSVTICSPGLNMKAVEEALLDDFDLWLKEKGKADEEGLKNRLDEFVEEKYKTTAEKILETIKAMNSPPPPSDEEKTSNKASSALQNLAACEGAGGESDKASRKKRSTAGKRAGDIALLCIFVFFDQVMSSYHFDRGRYLV